ncbi:hypothetical protein GCM10010968_18780 [Agrococcus terreus]|uniref:OLD protein-like TOPRIM domain-containing protein n=1 Tax=Agrococcus terreus TaxID=574649 RepID=A0ABQ2KKB3_9MICO|nr:hypothetical protein GCM10010968_18780 [Agrococcus terreus]
MLVEGESDRLAVLALARLQGRDLAAEGVEVVAMAGVTNTRTHALRLGPRGRGLALAGLYDAPAASRVRRGLADAGLEAALALAPDGLERIGFFGCDADLEDELVRALGADGGEAVVDAEGDGASLARLAQMPAQRGWTRERVLRRFFGAGARRKARYAPLLVEALGAERAPAPLRALLEHVRADGGVHEPIRRRA